MNEIENISNNYLAEILKKNEQINLTRITDYERAQLLHIEDSLAVLPEINDAPQGKMLDIGSGGGFPGVPLAIATKRETTLIDSVKKKMTAVNEVLHTLDLNTMIETKSERIEAYSRECPEIYSVITARALSSLPSIMELATPLLRKNGHLVCLKSHTTDEELETAKKISSKLGLKMISYRNYLLTDNETYREVIVFEKFKQPDIKLPRKTGMAQKRPLKE